MLVALLAMMTVLSVNDLPVGSAPTPVALPHFPTRLHAFVWRNWTLVPIERMGRVVHASPEQIRTIGKQMGLNPPPKIPAQQWRRSALTIIRRNWHLLPYDQLLTLLNWTPEQLEYTLREDDFLYIKLGSHKPKCEPVLYAPPTPETDRRTKELAELLHTTFPQGIPKPQSPLFDFVKSLSHTDKIAPEVITAPNGLRYCYSYFALYGDPLLDKEADPYPEGYLQKMAKVGVSGIWLQAVLYKLSPFPWEPRLSDQYEKRRENLRKLVARAKKYGMGVYLYLNEPRSMPHSFFTQHPTLKGVTEGEYATLCTSNPEVKRYLTDSIADLCRAVPDLAGFFTITYSENLTSCWSHGKGKDCPRCKERSAGEVIAEVNTALYAGIQQAKSPATLFAWDWAWTSEIAEGVIHRLPKGISLMSVSEWDMPINRGGTPSVVGEYSVSTVGPGERAKRHWNRAKEHGLSTLAKIQAANSWELSAVPYIPALENVAQHALNLRKAKVGGIMLGWTLGGYPSPNLEVISEIARLPENALQGNVLEQTLLKVATRRYGETAAPHVVEAWHGYSKAFREFPFHIGLVYTAPMQFGVSNLLWEKPTGYSATMIGFPYDDLETWRAVYPPDVFISQMRKVAQGFQESLTRLHNALPNQKTEELSREMGLVEAIVIHFQSTANQARFVLLRNRLQNTTPPSERQTLLQELDQILQEEAHLAKQLFTLQAQDSRIGFEASNQYYYVPQDLLEKIANCNYLRKHWLKTLKVAN
jgi:hypothetical protein